MAIDPAGPVAAVCGITWTLMTPTSVVSAVVAAVLCPFRKTAKQAYRLSKVAIWSGTAAFLAAAVAMVGTAGWTESRPTPASQIKTISDLLESALLSALTVIPPLVGLFTALISRRKIRRDHERDNPIVRASLPFTFLLLTLVTGCDARKPSTPASQTANRSGNSLPSDRVVALVHSLAQAQLPTGVTNVYGATASLFTKVVDVRFECSSAELQSFLLASPVLHDQLVVGKRAVVDTMGRHTWWQPDSLASVSGSEQSWRTTNGTVSALLMSGEAGEASRVVVYLSMTIE